MNIHEHCYANNSSIYFPETLLKLRRSSTSCKPYETRTPCLIKLTRLSNTFEGHKIPKIRQGDHSSITKIQFLTRAMHQASSEWVDLWRLPPTELRLEQPATARESTGTAAGDSGGDIAAGRQTQTVFVVPPSTPRITPPTASAAAAVESPFS